MVNKWVARGNESEQQARIRAEYELHKVERDTSGFGQHAHDWHAWGSTWLKCWQCPKVIQRQPDSRDERHYD